MTVSSLVMDKFMEDLEKDIEKENEVITRRRKELETRKKMQKTREQILEEIEIGIEREMNSTLLSVPVPNTRVQLADEMNRRLDRANRLDRRTEVIERLDKIVEENDVQQIVDHMNTCACGNPVSVDHFKSLICSPCVADIKMGSPFQDMQPMPATTTCNKEDGDSDGDDDDDEYDSEGDDDCEVSDNDDGGLHHTAVQLSCRLDKAPTPSSIQEHAARSSEKSLKEKAFARTGRYFEGHACSVMIFFYICCNIQYVISKVIRAQRSYA